MKEECQMTRQTRQATDQAHVTRFTRREVLSNAVRSGIGVAATSVVGVWTHAPSVVGAASRVTVGYLRAGYTCEGALFAAQAQGYFRDEGLELTTTAMAGSAETTAEMMKGNVDAMQDPAWALVPPLLPKEMSIGDMVATAGLQRGSMSLVVVANSSIRSVADLRGMKVSASARWRFAFGQPLSAAGLDPQKGIDWQPVLPPMQVGAALKTQQVAAAAVHQPYAAALESSGDGRILVAQNTPPLQDDYCCALVLPGALVRSDRQKAAAITRALMRGSAWVRAHPSESARIMIEAKHVTLSLADNQRAMVALDFFPSVEGARRNTLDILQRFQRLGFLDQATDMQAVLERIFVPVTGEL
jgi:NitT/TauT family transport system substrate-binding protein